MNLLYKKYNLRLIFFFFERVGAGERVGEEGHMLNMQGKQGERERETERKKK